MDEDEDLAQLLARVSTKEFWVNKITRKNLLRAGLALVILFCLRCFGALFASILGICLILYNLGDRGDGVSAYSVFNRNINYLLGDLRPAQVDQQIRNADVDVADHAEVYRPPVRAPGRSRDANKLCACGSNKKTKKCCGI